MGSRELEIEMARRDADDERRRAMRQACEDAAEGIMREATMHGVLVLSQLQAGLARALYERTEAAYNAGAARTRVDLAQQLNGTFCPHRASGFETCKGAQLLREVATRRSPAKVG